MADSIEGKIQIAKEKIEAGERGGSFVFESVIEVCRYIDVLTNSYHRHKEKIINAEFEVDSFDIDKIIQKAKGSIEAGDRGGSFVFGHTKGLHKYLGIALDTYHRHKEKIINAGFEVDSFDIDKIIQKAKDSIEAGDRGGSFFFDPQKDLILYLGISEGTYFSHKEKIINAGFKTRIFSVEEKIKYAKEKISEGDRGGSYVFESSAEIFEYIGISRATWSIHREGIRNAGFMVATSSISKNAKLSIRDCRSYNIKMENIELLPLLSQEFFSRSIRKDLEHLNAWSDFNGDITTSFSKEEMVNRVKTAILSLISDGKSDYSMLELKLELFLGGVYFSEESISGALIALGEDVNKIFEDNIYKRMRLSISFTDKGFIDIEYVEKLPLINNTEDGNVIIDESINNKKDFMKLWKEYTLFSAKNHITGHVSKRKLPDKWKGNLDALFEENRSYQKAYFLDSEGIDFLEKMSYEGILAMCQFGAKQSKKSLPKMYHSIHARCIGFFLYLNKKELALFHPRYFIFTGASSVSDTAIKILEDHVVLRGLEEALNTPGALKSDIIKLQKKNVHLHGLKFAGSVSRECNLKMISSEDIYAYLEHSAQELISGTIQHETFVLILLRILGNRGAVEKDKEFDIEEEIGRLVVVSAAKKDTLLDYKELLDEMLDVVKHILREGKSHGYIISYLKYIFTLMEYLSIFPKKFGRREMSEVLNTITVSKDKKSFKEWSAKKLSKREYSLFTQRIYIIFDSLTVNEEYAKLYHREWRVFKGKSDRTLIREGMEPVVYETLQRVALYDPPSAREYPFYKTTPNEEIVDLSWWNFDFSPVPVICNWLIIKLTRRKVSVRHLDVGTFLQYDENGQLKSMFVNTDKNRKSKDREISIHLLKFIFTDKELHLLEKYTEYIKNVYSGMTKVSYTTSANSYENIMPLFPHHTKNSVISDSWIDGYFNKTMLKTELLIKKYIEEGEYDRYFEEHEREAKKKILLQVRLLKKKGSCSANLPGKLDELDRYTIPSYASKFTTTQGIHNMRHAGISALGAKLPLMYVRIIAGHSDINTTGRIYFHANEDIIAKEVLAADFDGLSEPAKKGSSFIDRTIMPLIESSDPKMIEEELLKNNFMSCPREATIKIEAEWVEHGIELASAIHPASWTAYNHGICPSGQCPPESRGCCALCPLLIYSPLHLRGVAYQLNKSLIDLALLGQKIGMDMSKNINTSREELHLKYQQKMNEMVGWFEVINSIARKISSDGADNGSPLSLIDAMSGTRDVMSFRSCGIDESIVEQLVDAVKLKIDNEDTDNYIARISHKMLLAAIRDYNPDILRKIEKEGIRWFVDEYGEKAFSEKQEYLLRYINPDKSSGNLATLETDVKTLELLSAD